MGKEMNGSFYHNTVSQKIGQIEQAKKAMAQQEKMVEQQKAAMLASGIGPGLMAPDLNYENPSGKHIALSDLRGKVVLLDFWASWCKPCRAENPNVVRLYNKYKDKGFTVYSYSLDKTKVAWTTAINTDGLIWPNHTSDLKGWQAAGAATYKVQSIPATFLIGRDGKIIDSGLRGAALEAKLEELFES